MLEGGVAVGEIREVDIPDDVDGGGVEGGGGVSRVEGTGIAEVSDGTGESNEPDMLSILDDEARLDDGRRGRNLDAREEGRVLVIRTIAHGVEGGKVYIAVYERDRQHE